MNKLFQICMDRFWTDLRGTVSVEFVLAVPVILVIYTLTFGTFHAYLQSSRAAKAMYTVSDIISRYHIISETNLVQAQSLLDTIYIGNSAGFHLRVTRVSFVSDDAVAADPSIDTSSMYDTDTGYYFVDWSRAMPHEDPSAPDTSGGNGFDLLVNDDLINYDMPTLASGAHVLLIDVSVDYESPLAGRQLFFGIGSFFGGLTWAFDCFIWPRDPRGIFLETSSGVLVPAV